MDNQSRVRSIQKGIVMALRLQRLRLKNAQQHRELDQSFDGTLIGVLGENGSGKSNFLGMLQFCLTGEHPSSKKDDLLTWGQTSGYAELEFLLDNRKYIINRSLSSPKCVLTGPDLEVSGIAKTNEAMSQILGLDKDLLKQGAFVGQAEIDAILFEDPAQRARGFQRFCGISEADKIYKKLGDCIPGDPDIEALESGVRRAKQTIDEKLKAIAELNARVDQQTKALADMPGKPELVTRRDTVLALKQVGIDANRVSQDLQKLRLEYRGIAADLAALPECSAEDSSETRTRLSGFSSAAKLVDRLKTEIKSLEKELADIGTRPESIKGYQENLAALKTEYECCRDTKAGIDSEIQVFEALMAAVNSADLKSARCPVCDSPIGSEVPLGAKLEACRARAKTFDYTDVQQRLTELQRQARETETRQRNWDSRRQSITQTLEAKATELKSAELDLKANKVPGFETQEAADQEFLRLKSAAESAILLASKIKSVEERKSENMYIGKAKAEDLKRLEAQRLEHIKALGQAPEDLDAEINKLDTLIASRDSLELELSASRASINVCATSIAELESEIPGLEALVKEKRELQVKLDVLKDVRRWFHYSNGPQTLVSSVIQEMTADVNSFLELFDSEFYVVSGSDGQEFRYHYRDGRQGQKTEGTETSKLSGGQKMQLALAFRFATYCMFAGKLGLLSLDEPTVYLDARRVGKFCQVLEKVRDLANSMGLQVILATHENQVLSALDLGIQV
jgi:DNA repair exonuclease SbcCD ATPase subunit